MWRPMLMTLALASVSCARPPRASPAAHEARPPLTAPPYPSWEEISPPAPASWRIEAPAESRPLITTATCHSLRVSKAGRSTGLEIIHFNDQDHDLCIIDQPQDWSGGGKITECMRRAGAVAGVNGGFFTPGFQPMGLMIASGRKSGTWQSNALLTGAVVVQNSPRLLWNAELHSQEARELIQAGPRLVDCGSPVAGLERRRHTTRTFIATDGAHRWVIGIAHSTSLGELAEILATARLLPGFKVERALNLDGGRSSAIYYRGADGREHASPGWSTVRNYLAIIPR